MSTPQNKLHSGAKKNKTSACKLSSWKGLFFFHFANRIQKMFNLPALSTTTTVKSEMCSFVDILSFALGDVGPKWATATVCFLRGTEPYSGITSKTSTRFACARFQIYSGIMQCANVTQQTRKREVKPKQNHQINATEWLSKTNFWLSRSKATTVSREAGQR